mmetsp:Transcript_30030/g.61273  ORF Transcript_30030/g.61273 Transcript_30030/m.61273 type:complete len:358 (-) Transcript_30030:217-1290(-)|eukprot:CAMPEP_0183296616 /NCGR_PEP_ID=MMETSP0160_2-20130417/4090_1 /TAXON_ID=2839 ORGANISM="Odontella Sinensis, Strain Grunow 1884" /NCGR_SAMPLE_ID=MMETSP0160_2 /ASSEMBLY_ACC=CAM_ASM_000250 /LENGTH=357 /DNA_ID=CAMNT_0025458247 /DNA_START=46 /DNA_END=1119 /DNA_ORIENTATION=+
MSARNKRDIGQDDGSVVPDYLTIPLDDDGRYSRSFSVSETGSSDAAVFFEKYGFVIFRDVISDERCDDVVDDMWGLLGELSPTIRRNDPDTWAKGLTHFGMPKGVKAIFRPSLLSLRQDPAVVACFASVLGTDAIVSSHDRWLLHRPTRDVSGPGDDRPGWESRRNIHLDLNPWEFIDDDSAGAVRRRLSDLRYADKRSFISENNDVHAFMGRSVQGILNLRDVTSQDSGGTILVPGSHKTFKSWVVGGCPDERQRIKGPMQYRVGACDLLQPFAQHLTLRKGSLLIWDQRCVHGSTPNRSPSFRAAIPIRFFNANVLRDQEKRAKDRANEVSRQIDAVGFGNFVSPLGRQVFGLTM